MGIADELMKLEQLRKSGALTGAEFQAAKREVLHPAPSSEKPQGSSQAGLENVLNDLQQDQSLGRAANRYVSYTGVTQVIFLIVFLVVAVTIASVACSHMGPTDGITRYP